MNKSWVGGGWIVRGLSQYKDAVVCTLFYQSRDPHDKDKSHNGLIFIIGIPVPGEMVFLLKQVIGS